MPKPSPFLTREELPSIPVPERALDAIAADGNLPVCETCGTQYTEKPSGDGICELTSSYLLD